MATGIFGSKHHRRPFHALALFSLLLLIEEGSAHEFQVGGARGWTVPNDSNTSNYSQWAEANRFHIGDTLLFVYPADNDSVLYVSDEDYSHCSTATYLKKFSDGHTVFMLNHSGAYHFISGVEDNCLKNEKVVVVVMADRSSQSSNSNHTSNIASPPPSGSVEVTPSPSPGLDPATRDAPPLAPSVETSPPPAPAGQESPPPPPEPVGTNPSPAPANGHTPPPGSASSMLLSFMGSIGALAGSSILLIL